MNATDLRLANVLEIVQAIFPEARISGNVVKVNYSELTTDQIVSVAKLTVDHPEIKPWVFRSGKGIRLTFFIKEGNGFFATPDRVRRWQNAEVGPEDK